MGYAVAEINDLVMVRCLECENMHQQKRFKNHFLCFITGKRIEHEIDEIIWCNEYQPMKSKDDRLLYPIIKFEQRAHSRVRWKQSNG